MKKIQMCIVVVLILPILVSCGNSRADNPPADLGMKKNETENQTCSDSAIPEPSDSNWLSPQIRNGSQWTDINPILSVLGKSAQEIMDTQITSYFHFTDGDEIFLVNGSAYLCFSDAVWAPESRCILIGIPPTWLSGKTGFDGDVKIADIETKTGVTPEFYDRGDAFYFRYRFEDMEIRIFTKEDGATLYDDTDIKHYTTVFKPGVEPKSATTADPKAEERVVNAKDIRLGDEWEKTNYYISQIGKTLSEIEAVLGYSLENNDNFFIDPTTHVGYRFDNSGVCEWLWGTPSLFLPHKNGLMTKDELLAYWNNVNYIRSSYEGYDYVFEFEDVSIAIYETTHEGNVNDASVVDIKRKIGNP
jgi:hypothetical protein